MRLVLLLALALVAGCLGEEEAPAPAPVGNVQTDDATLRPIEERFEGAATGTPASPGVYDFPFEVPSGAVGVNGTLAWSSPVTRITLQLLDPQGEVVDEGYPDVNGHLIVATVEPPRPGAWTFRVSSDLAVEDPFTLDAVAELIVPANNVVAKQLSLGQRGFYEVNLILEANATFTFSYNSTQPLRWDIHSHPPEGLKEWETGEGTTGGTTFTAPARSGYSILWENTAALPADVDLQVVGAFRIHSHAG